MKYKILILFSFCISLCLGCLHDRSGEDGDKNCKELWDLYYTNMPKGNIIYTLDNESNELDYYELVDNNTFFWCEIAHIKIEFPSNVGPGIYTYADGFVFQFAKDNQSKIFTNENTNFSITIEEWGGYGGVAMGSFNGQLENSGEFITLSDGKFSADIKKRPAMPPCL